MTSDDDRSPAPEASDLSQSAVDAPEPEWKRRRRLAQVFGDVLPDQTEDDRDARGSAGKSDDWYREQVPPHHG